MKIFRGLTAATLILGAAYAGGVTLGTDNATAGAAAPEVRGGRSGPGPDIVYMSARGTTEALSRTAVRGITLAQDGSSGDDTSLQRSKAGRESQNIVWSPDGERMAWIEIGLRIRSTPVSIMVATPGRKAVAVHTYVPGEGQPQISGSVDSLAWGPDCSDASASVLVFSTYNPHAIFGIRFVGGQPGQPEKLVEFEERDGMIPPQAFAFSPTGEHLAFAGWDADLAYGVMMLPMCTADRTPFMVVPASELGGTEPWPIRSIDWSRGGDRLALSVTTGPDEDFPWRDLKVVGLSYVDSGGVEQITGYANVWTVDLTDAFTAASSEHSPQWGPAYEGDTCQRLAFSQSSESAPRGLYLLDVNDGYVGGCEINAPLKLPAEHPRALDWK